MNTAATMKQGEPEQKSTDAESAKSHIAGIDSPPGWPKLDHAALYGLPGEIVRAIAPHTEADPVGLLAHLLAKASCYMGRGPYVELDGSPNPLLFWPVVVGDTGKSRKGSASKRIDRMFKDAFPEWTGGAFRGALSTGEGLAFAVRDPMSEKDKGVEDKRLYLVQSEFGSMLKVMSRDGNSLSGAIRDAWDGEDLAYMTKNKRVRATAPHIVIVGHVTREELVKHLTDTEKSNGFGNRFVWFAVRRTQNLPFARTTPNAIMKPLVQKLREALAFANVQKEIKLSPEGCTAWEKAYDVLSDGKPGVVGALLGRAEAHVRRIATLYALLDKRRAVEPTHLRAAIALWQYAEDSVDWVFSGSSLQSDEDMTKTIHRAVMQQGELDDSGISALFHRSIPAARLNGFKKTLENAGLIHPKQVSSGGRPRTVWKPGRPVAP